MTVDKPEKHTVAKVILIDSFGNLFVAGMARDTDDIHHWIVRFSSDFGKTWKTIDDYEGDRGAIVVSGGVAEKPRAIFLTGYEISSTGAFRWITREVNY